MIDVLKEKVLTLSDAAKLLPRRRQGKRPHPGTLSRWSKAGLKNVFLETVVVGSTTCTSEEALQRFIEKLTMANGRAKPSTSVSALRRAEQHVERELDERGL